MKKFFILMAMFLGSCIAYSQVEPGTIESFGGGQGRGITADGLSQLYAVSGLYTLSADGAGSVSSSYTIDVDKPNASATVHKAYLMGVPVYTSSIPVNSVSFAATTIVWDGSALNSFGSLNYYADVTSIVSPILNPAAPGITSIPVVESSSSFVDGVALLVIFADPLTFTKTIVILFGGLSTAGDNYSITLGTPIDPIAPGAFLNMGLGIEFGFQGSAQYSIVNVNGQRLTTAAGGGDDAVGTIANSSLITVGGIGDLNTNPVNPFALPTTHRSDDELYSLLPFITDATVNILVNTINPSDDDNIFLSYFEISGVAIIGEGILLSQEEDVNPVGTDHTVMALVQNNLGAPVVGTLVDFTVVSGPNAGETYSEVTDANGNAFFTYTGSGGIGIDEIEACFTDSQAVYRCSNILEKEWIQGDVPPVPLSNWALVIGIMLILGAAIIRFRR
jgi:hypothetical protein